MFNKITWILCVHSLCPLQRHAADSHYSGWMESLIWCHNKLLSIAICIKNIIIVHSSVDSLNIIFQVNNVRRMEYGAVVAPFTVFMYKCVCSVCRLSVWTLHLYNSTESALNMYQTITWLNTSMTTTVIEVAGTLSDSTYLCLSTYVKSTFVSFVHQNEWVNIERTTWKY